jgi:hypothetical protein
MAPVGSAETLRQHQLQRLLLTGSAPPQPAMRTNAIVQTRMKRRIQNAAPIDGDPSPGIISIPEPSKSGEARKKRGLAAAEWLFPSMKKPDGPGKKDSRAVEKR